MNSAILTKLVDEIIDKLKNDKNFLAVWNSSTEDERVEYRNSLTKFYETQINLSLDNGVNKLNKAISKINTSLKKEK